MEKQMTPQDIVKAEIESRDANDDWRIAYYTMAECVKKPEWRLFRSDDTIFLIHNNKNSRKGVFFYIFNGEKEESKLIQNIKDFFKALKKSGFELAAFTPVGKHTEETISKTGYPYINIKNTNRLGITL